MADEPKLSRSGEHRRRMVIRDQLTAAEQAQRIVDMRAKREDEIVTIKELREQVTALNLRLDHLTTALRALLDEV